MFGVAGVLYTALFMGLRFISGDYAQGGKFLSELRSEQAREYLHMYVCIY